jgi:hypothetical protein
VSRYGAETIGCHEKNGRAGDSRILHTPGTQQTRGRAEHAEAEQKQRQREEKTHGRRAWRGRRTAGRVVLGQRACVRAMVPDAGGRGICD